MSNAEKSLTTRRMGALPWKATWSGKTWGVRDSICHQDTKVPTKPATQSFAGGHKINNLRGSHHAYLTQIPQKLVPKYCIVISRE